MPRLKPLAGLAVLDVGCGGGLMSEPLARLGAKVTGIDPTADAIAVARRHAGAQGLAIDYRTATVEDLQAEGMCFDAVICMEVIEHVPNQAAFVRSLGELVRPGGAVVVSTLNRTWKSYLLAIIGAEYVLGWLPRGTHDWNRFVTTDELVRYLANAGFGEPEMSGIIYDVMADDWRLGPDTDVNYIAAGARLRAPFVTLGVVPEAASSYLLPIVVGQQRAAELLFTARWIDAEESVALGICFAVVARERLFDTALAKAEQIAANPPEAVRHTKRLLRVWRRDRIAAARQREDDAFQERLGSAENMEAIRAFLEKRQRS